MASAIIEKDSFVNVTIVGGGLNRIDSGLLFRPCKAGLDHQFYEQAPRFGGKIQTQRVDDFVVEFGPDSYLGRKTEMTDLVMISD